MLVAAGFAPSERIRIPGGEVIARTADDVLANYLSSSSSAPHLFGVRLPAFESDVRRVLAAASPSGQFAERTNGTEFRIWRKLAP